jgi:hypothetical protein
MSIRRGIPANISIYPPDTTLLQAAQGRVGNHPTRNRITSAATVGIFVALTGNAVVNYPVAVIVYAVTDLNVVARVVAARQRTRLAVTHAFLAQVGVCAVARSADLRIF